MARAINAKNGWSNIGNVAAIPTNPTVSVMGKPIA